METTKSDFHIEIKDYQSLDNVVLDLVSGINIITGKTNVGKSATFRAISDCIYNTTDDSKIKSGKRYCGIVISNGNHTLKYIRDSKSKAEKTAYQIDNFPVQRKVGRNQLEEVARYFNIRDIRMSNNVKLKLNFWYQSDKPFLMDKTAGQLYEFLSLSSCDKYENVYKVMVKDRKSLEKDIHELSTKIDTYKTIINEKNKIIDSNVGYSELYEKITKCYLFIGKLNTLIDKINLLHTENTKISDTESKLNEINDSLNSINLKVNETEDILNKIKKDSDNYMSLKDKLSILYDYSDRISKSNESLKNSTNQLNKINSDYDSISDNLKNIIAYNSKLNNSYMLYNKSLQNKNKLNDISKQLDDISKSVVSNKDITNIENKINSINLTYNNYVNYKGYLTNVKLLSDRGILIEDKISENTKDIVSINESLKTFKDKVGYCPFCGKAL